MTSPSERNTGLRAALAHPTPYNLLHRAFGVHEFRRLFANEYVRAREGQRVLDIGCGTAEIVPLLPPVQYLGFEPNARYVAHARAHLPPNARIVHDRVSGMSLAGEAPFDVVMVNSVLHHLDDDEALQVFALAKEHLAPGGRLVTADNVWAPDQSTVARVLIALDRGQWVRSASGYRALAEAAGLRGVETVVRHDLLYVPYSYCILTWQKPG